MPAWWKLNKIVCQHSSVPPNLPIRLSSLSLLTVPWFPRSDPVCVSLPLHALLDGAIKWRNVSHFGVDWSIRAWNRFEQTVCWHWWLLWSYSSWDRSAKLPVMTWALAWSWWLEDCHAHPCSLCLHIMSTGGLLVSRLLNVSGLNSIVSYNGDRTSGYWMNAWAAVVTLHSWQFLSCRWKSGHVKLDVWARFWCTFA